MPLRAACPPVGRAYEQNAFELNVSFEVERLVTVTVDNTRGHAGLPVQNTQLTTMCHDKKTVACEVKQSQETEKRSHCKGRGKERKSVCKREKI